LCEVMIGWLLQDPTPSPITVMNARRLKPVSVGARILTAQPIAKEGVGQPMSALGHKRKFSPRAHFVRFIPDSGHQSGHTWSALCQKET
jgi:hypothetical protein